MTRDDLRALRELANAAVDPDAPPPVMGEAYGTLLLKLIEEHEVQAAPARVFPSDTRLWHIISRHQREAGLEETVPLNRAMYRACMEAMMDVDVALREDKK